MCLVTTKRECFVAKKNIHVYKVLREIDGHYYTPFTDFEVSLNTTIHPKEDSGLYVQDAGWKYKIAKGFIHSYTGVGGLSFLQKSPLFDDVILYIYHAYIPKGAKFYIDERYLEIASEKLFITNRKVRKVKSGEFDSFFPQCVINSYEQNRTKEVEVGDILLSDKTFIKPTEYVKCQSKVPIGVVVCFMDNIAYVCGRHPKRALYKEPSDFFGSSALQYCENYQTIGTEQGDWFLPSVPELMFVSWNVLRINATLWLLGADLIDDELFWSSEQVKDILLNMPAKVVNMRENTCIKRAQYYAAVALPFIKIPLNNKQNENTES